VGHQHIQPQGYHGSEGRKDVTPTITQANLFLLAAVLLTALLVAQAAENPCTVELFSNIGHKDRCDPAAIPPGSHLFNPILPIRETVSALAAPINAGHTQRYG
jgi:hypothetical protein